MDLIEAIKVYDDFLPKIINDDLFEWLKITKEFEDASVIGTETNIIAKEIRRTETMNFNKLSNSLTNVKFFHLLGQYFQKITQVYNQEFNNEISIKSITEISALRYGVGGHYKFHTDHHFKIPRTLSLIYMVNDEYEGGPLCFKGPRTIDTEILKKIEPKKNRLIVWPSSHLFPHAVESVKKGVRYTIVCWAA